MRIILIGQAAFAEKTLEKLVGKGEEVVAVYCPLDPPSGCAFHPRCPLLIERCRAEAPPETRVAAQHRARCWLAAEAPARLIK